MNRQADPSPARKPRASYGSRVMLLCFVVLLFLLNFWMAYQRSFSSDFDATHFQSWVGEDQMALMVHGRQLADCGRISTFEWPGYMWHGTVKETLLFLPALVWGFHEWIPILMVALVGVSIPLMAFGLAFRLFGWRVALIAGVLCGATDLFIAKYVFMLAFPFDVQVLLSLGFGLLVVNWVWRTRHSGEQPGAGYCLVTGVLAGVLWYAHPVSLCPMLAAALFMFLSLGRRVFTWRLLVVLAAALVGSLRLWIFWWRHVPLYAFTSLDDTRSSRYTWSEYLWGGDGFFGFLFSPSGNPLIQWVMAGVFVLTLVYAARCLVAFLRSHPSGLLAGLWREGWPVPLYGYGILLFPFYMVFMQRVSGTARFGGPVHDYSVELCFWMLMAVAAWLGRLWAWYRWAGLLVVVALAGFLYVNLLVGFPRPTPKLLKLYEDYRADAATLIKEKKQPLLYLQEMNGALYSYLAPAPLVAADGLWNLGLRDPVATVEQHPAPCVLARLDEQILGRNAWRVTPLKTGMVYDQFLMPPAGRWLSPASWEWSVCGSPFQHRGGLADGNLGTAWNQAGASVASNLVLEVKFDEPREICRLVILALCKGLSWYPSTYFRFKTHFMRTERSLESLPACLRVEGCRADSGAWETILSNANNEVDDTFFFWDGGRLFYDGHERYRLDIRMPPGKYRALRVTEQNFTKNLPRQMAEIALFEMAAPPAVPAAEPQLFARIKALSPRRVYADRYISAQLRKHQPGVAVWEPSVLRNPCFMDIWQADWPWLSALEPFQPEGAVVVADSAWAPAIAQMLEEEQIPCKQESFGAWTLFDFPARQGGQASRRALVWNGMSVFRYPDRSLSAPLSAPPARPFVRNFCFENGAELGAVEMTPDRVRRGESLRVKVYWKIPPHWAGAERRPRLYCHIRQGRDHLVDGDHLMLESFSTFDLLDLREGEWLVDECSMVVPAGARSGPCQLEISLCEGETRVPLTAAPNGIRVTRGSTIWLDACELLP